jgi:osmotically-inducible protein OsmY
MADKMMERFLRPGLTILAVALVTSACTHPTGWIDAATTVAEDRSLSQVATDGEIRLDLNKKLLGGKYRDLFLEVSTDVHEGRVMLTGSVKTVANKNRITELAQDITGIRTIYNDMQVTDEGDFKSVANNVWIESKIKARLVAEKGVGSINLRWRAVNSVVYVIGRLRTAKEMAKVLTVIHDVDHVTKAINHIVIKPAPLRPDKPY